MKDIPLYNTFAKIEPIAKGESEDKKYIVENIDGQKLILRISDIKNIDIKKAEYQMIKQAYTSGILTPRPIDFGLCGGGKNVYQIFRYLEGEDLQSLLQNMTGKEHYIYGAKAGKLLAQIHTIATPSNALPFDKWFIKYVSESIDNYNNKGIKFKEIDILVEYIQKNSYLLKNRPQTFIHSDFIDANIIVTLNGSLGVIDFNYEIYETGYGDPWLDIIFNEYWDEKISPCYSTGFIKGYFGGEPPREFFNMLALYFSIEVVAVFNELSKEGEVREGLDDARHLLRWFDNMNDPVPIWYDR